MADKQQAVHDQLSERFLTCSICLERYKNARILPCHHSFCVECLTKYVEMQKVFKCPLCKQSCNTPKDGVSSLPASIHVNDIMEILGKHVTVSSVEVSAVGTATTETDKTCQICEAASKFSRCIDCGLDICSRCTKGHRKVPATRAHQIISYEEYETAKATDHFLAAPRTVTQKKGLVSQFGEKGRQTGQLGDYLRGVSMTTKGDVLVSDPGNNRLQTFTLHGTQPRVIQFSGFSKPVRPQFTAVTKEGHIFVTDGDNSQVFECNENGKLIRYFDETNLNHPLGIAVNSSNGRVYVVDNVSHCVHIYKINGKYIKSFGSQGSGEGKLDCPWCVSIDYNTGNVIISDRGNNRINVYTENGDYLFTFGNDPSKVGQCNCPFGVATDKVGNMYVCNYGDNNVMKYDPFGNFIFRINRYQDDLRSPVGICVTDDEPCEIVVSESDAGHIKVYAQ
ncbi:uncharacterized protein LOC144450270 [Glandiceps talaboti]